MLLTEPAGRKVPVHAAPLDGMSVLQPSGIGEIVADGDHIEPGHTVDGTVSPERDRCRARDLEGLEPQLGFTSAARVPQQHRGPRARQDPGPRLQPIAGPGSK